MHSLIVLNREIVDASESFLPAISPAALYGRGVFTTIAVYNSKPFQWEKHWQRLSEEAGAVGIDLHEFSASEVKDTLTNLIRQNEMQTGRARVTFFDLAARSNLWKIERDFKTACLMTTADFRPTPEKLRLTVSPYPVNSASPIARLKTCNYLENLLAIEEAAGRGFDEAIRVNERSEIVSATMANVFWVKDQQIFTAHPAAGAVAGTTRAFVLENFPVIERAASLNDLANADEIFLTSAGFGIAPIENFERKAFERIEISAVIENFFKKYVSGS